jgi:hypothetical protein
MKAKECVINIVDLTTFYLISFQLDCMIFHPIDMKTSSFLGSDAFVASFRVMCFSDSINSLLID